MEKVKLTNYKKINEPTKEEAYDNLIIHQNNIYRVLLEISYLLREQAYNHDWTKKVYYNEYYNDLTERKTNPDPYNREWIKKHTSIEKHHITLNTHPDITLLDLIEMITDCIITAKNNHTEIDYEYLNISEEILKTAYNNTIKLINKNTELKIK